MSSPPFSLPAAAEVSLADALPAWIHDHVKLYLTDPAAAHDWDASGAGAAGTVPTLLLLTRGRRTGKTLPLPLIYQKQGEDYLVIASKGGAPAHPAWYLNLEADAHCAVQVGAHFCQGIARTLTGSERQAAWQAMAAVFPPYNNYQTAAGDREIPVVAIRPT